MQKYKLGNLRKSGYNLEYEYKYYFEMYIKHVNILLGADIFGLMSENSFAKVKGVMDEKKGIEITTHSQASVVSFQSASISDAEEINTISNKISDFIEKNKPQKLIFDFKQVKFFSSQILGMLLNIRNRLSVYNGEVIIIAINPQLHRVFKITNLDKIFRFFPNVKSAIETTSISEE